MSLREGGVLSRWEGRRRWEAEVRMRGTEARGGGGASGEVRGEGGGDDDSGDNGESTACSLDV